MIEVGIASRWEVALLNTVLVLYLSVSPPITDLRRDTDTPIPSPMYEYSKKMMLSTAIVTLFIICDALSFSFSPIPLAKSRSSLAVRSFILEPSENGSSTRCKKRFHLPSRDDVVEHQALCDFATNNRIINSKVDGGIIKKYDLFSRIEETMEFAGFESSLRAGGKETFFALIILYGIKIFRNKYLLKVCKAIVFIISVNFLWKCS